MSTDEQKAVLQRMVDEAGGEGPHMCPLCFYRLPTPEAKTKHLEISHGYETLQVVPMNG